MIEYADKSRTQDEIRQLFFNLIRRERKTEADAFRRRILKDRINKALKK